MKIHILLAEDDNSMRTMLTVVLRKADYHVTPASDGETALALLERAIAEHSPYDVVLTDIQMGKVDGMAVLQAARRQHPPAAVILLTGYASVETAIEALRAGAYDYLQKPCKNADLLKCVANAIEQRNAQLHQEAALQTLTQVVHQLQDHVHIHPNVNGQDAPQPIPHTPTPSQPTPDNTDRYIRVGLLSMDLFRHEVLFAERPVNPTPLEYALLQCLGLAKGRVLSPQEIASTIYNRDMDSSEAVLLLKPHIRNLRRKIPDPRYLVTVRGAGYRLEAPDDSGD